MYKLLLGVGLLSVFSVVQADTSLESLKNISQELVDIRQQIEELHNQINFEKDSFREQMRSYASQKSDLDVRISRAELNIKDLQRELKKLTEISSKKTSGNDELMPVLKEAIASVRRSVSASLPFMLEQRLQALDEIENRIDTHLVSPNKAANQLWAFMEDELMLGKNSGIYNDTLKNNGEEKLVKVLRLGKIAMFYKTHDGRFGQIKRENGAWTTHHLDDASSVAQLEKLFDSFSKNIRNGQFVTPDFLPRS